MSRHIIPAKNKTLELQVGWEPLFRGFYATGYDISLPEGASMVFTIGATDGDRIESTETLANRLKLISGETIPGFVLMQLAVAQAAATQTRLLPASDFLKVA